MNFKLKDNLLRPQRKALKKLDKNNGTKIYPFHKDTGSVVLKEDDAIKKIEEQLAKTTIIDFDPTRRRTHKTQKTLCQLQKENKFINKENFDLYPSDIIPNSSKFINSQGATMQKNQITLQTNRYFADLFFGIERC